MRLNLDTVLYYNRRYVNNGPLAGGGTQNCSIKPVAVIEFKYYSQMKNMGKAGQNDILYTPQIYMKNITLVQTVIIRVTYIQKRQ